MSDWFTWITILILATYVVGGLAAVTDRPSLRWAAVALATTVVVLAAAAAVAVS